jgi:hypothetical protein
MAVLLLKSSLVSTNCHPVGDECQTGSHKTQAAANPGQRFREPNHHQSFNKDSQKISPARWGLCYCRISEQLRKRFSCSKDFDMTLHPSSSPTGLKDSGQFRADRGLLSGGCVYRSPVNVFNRPVNLIIGIKMIISVDPKPK